MATPPFSSNTTALVTLCLEPEHESDPPVDTSVKSAALEVSPVNAKTAALTSVEEHSERLRDLTLPTIPTIPTPSELSQSLKPHCQSPAKSTIASTTLNDHDLKYTPVILEDQRVFYREPATRALNILNSFFKPSEHGVPNTCIPPSTHDPSGPIPKLLEALPASGRTSKDPLATHPTKIKPDSQIIIPKGCDLDDLICSLEDLLARLEWEDPVNRMPVTASISLGEGSEL